MSNHVLVTTQPRNLKFYSEVRLKLEQPGIDF